MEKILWKAIIIGVLVGITVGILGSLAGLSLLATGVISGILGAAILLVSIP